MQRIRIAERAQWRVRAEEAGFRFHTIDGQPYWDESAYYAFTLRQIEQDIEDPSAELHQMALDLVGDVIASERLMDQLAIPSHYRDWIADSWRQRQPKKTVAPSITCATALRRPACMARPSPSRTSVCPRTAASPRWTIR